VTHGERQDEVTVTDIQTRDGTEGMVNSYFHEIQIFTHHYVMNDTN